MWVGLFGAEQFNLEISGLYDLESGVFQHVRSDYWSRV